MNDLERCCPKTLLQGENVEEKLVLWVTVIFS